MNLVLQLLNLLVLCCNLFLMFRHICRVILHRLSLAGFGGELSLASGLLDFLAWADLHGKNGLVGAT